PTEKVVLRDLKISPCLEIYNCLKDGQCAIKDDMTALYDKLTGVRILIVASPIFFYGPSAQLKAVIDRCQALWSRKYSLGWKTDHQPGRGYVLSVAATQGKRLFDGLLLTMKYFFDVLGLKLDGQVLVRGVDQPGEILDKPEFLSQARTMGEAAAEFIIQEERIS
ncbi:MAG: flavodoxin family protein, partial [Deltaproteobacteria bacterium]|nr:flavodoxin family protein [Deltaproteobacteria bacterium]